MPHLHGKPVNLFLQAPVRRGFSIVLLLQLRQFGRHPSGPRARSLGRGDNRWRRNSRDRQGLPGRGLSPQRLQRLLPVRDLGGETVRLRVQQPVLGGFGLVLLFELRELRRKARGLRILAGRLGRGRGGDSASGPAGALLGDEAWAVSTCCCGWVCATSMETGAATGAGLDG